MHIRFLTAGESHGPALCGIIEGLPAGIRIHEEDFTKAMLKRRQGYGRGNRIKIESDKIEVLSGIIGGKTTGSPIALLIRNNDYESHEMYMHPFRRSVGGEIPVPLPGHADFAGTRKFGFDNCRFVRERASARETAMRVALSVPAQLFLRRCNVGSLCFVESIGGVDAKIDWTLSQKELEKKISANKKYFLTPDAEVVEKWIKLIDEAERRQETLGGTGCVIFYDMPIGMGNYIQWDKRLDAKLAAHIMSIQGIKGVEFGLAKKVSEAQEDCTDGILYHKGKHDRKRYSRTSNHAAGLEGGMSNGAPIIVRFHMKPLPANSQKESYNLKTLEAARTSYYRSDVCAVQTAAVVAEAMASICIANEILIY
jgi:chorismate synthase